MTITEQQAEQMAQECGMNWRFHSFRHEKMEVSFDQLKAFANLTAASVEAREMKLREHLLSCRGSVKDDLTKYEMTLFYKGDMAPEQRMAIELEVTRLTALLDTIDAAIASDKEGRKG